MLTLTYTRVHTTLQLQEKLSLARAKLGAVDHATGRPLYKPQTGRAPAFERRGAVYDNLYQLSAGRVSSRAMFIADCHFWGMQTAVRSAFEEA